MSSIICRRVLNCQSLLPRDPPLFRLRWDLRTWETLTKGSPCLRPASLGGLFVCGIILARLRVFLICPLNRRPTFFSSLFLSIFDTICWAKQECSRTESSWSSVFISSSYRFICFFVVLISFYKLKSLF